MSSSNGSKPPYAPQPNRARSWLFVEDLRTAKAIAIWRWPWRLTSADRLYWLAAAFAVVASGGG